MSKKKGLPSLFRKGAPKQVDPETLQRIVEKTFEGMGPTEIGRELNLSHVMIINYKKHVDFSKTMAEYLRYHISNRMGEISDALFKAVKKGDIKAVALALKAVGAVDSKDSGVEVKDTSITVIMPGAKPADQVIEVVSEDKREWDTTSQEL